MLARERIGRVPCVVERLEAHGAGVEHDEAADEPLAEPDDFPDHFERHQRAEHAGERAEDAGLRASGNRAGRRRLGEKAAIGRVGRSVRLALVGPQRGERAVENADRGGDERLLRKEASVRHQIARGEIVGAVGNDVIAGDQRERVCRGEPRRVRLHRHVRVEAADRGRRALHFGPADFGRAMDDLALQVRERDRVVVDDADRRQIEQRRRAQPAGADDQHARALERLLPRPADLAQDDVAGVAFELLRTEHRLSPSPFYALIGESDGFATRDDRLDLSTRDARCQHRHSFVNRGGRFSMKAAMPSLRSLVANKAWKTRRSKRTPSASDVSKLRLTASFAASSDGCDIAAMVSATFIASSIRLAARTTRATRPERSASAASIMRPVKIRSMALALPTARVRRCVPPMPGITPSLISGWPNFALSAAMIRSHCIASSHPPPSAKPATAATTGLRTCASRSQRPTKSAMNASMNDLPAISLISAPAANALSEPVTRMHPILPSTSNASIAALSSEISDALSALSAC